MRDIRFRAWDKDKKRMWLLRRLDFDENGVKKYTTGELYPIMQFTGLHDKNGKEIYEGDIVQVDSQNMNTLTEEKHKAVVEWCQPYTKFLLQYLKNNTAFLEIAGKSREVIGNIYENPELLK